MIIQVQRDRNAIRINQDFASAVTEFAAVLEDERLGTPFLAYVIYSLDMADDNIFQHIPEEMRKHEVAESLKLDKALLKDPKVVAAMKKYKFFVEQNISYQFKDSYIGGMKKVSDYVKDKKKINDDDAKKFTDVLAEMPALLKGKGDIDKMGTKEAGKGIIRGKKELTINERNAAN